MTRAEKFMREAIRLSIDAVHGNCGGPFGAVVVRGDEIVGRGCNRFTSTNDPTAHAEIVAVRDACRNLNTFQLDNCEIFSSCEPCPMCLAAIYWARLQKLYFGNTRQDAAGIGFDDASIYQQVALPPAARSLRCEQLLAVEAAAAFAEWKIKVDKIPY